MIGRPAILGAPSAIGLSPRPGGGPRGVGHAPRALRDQGLAARLGAPDLGDVVPPPRYADPVRPAGRERNSGDVAAYSAQLGRRVEALAGDGRFVVLLGGDCSILLGSLLGLRQARPLPVGVVYVDAHADFATLEESPSGSPCSMCLALATGRAATPLSRLDSEPLVRPEHVAHVGGRDVGGPYGRDALAGFGVLDLDGATLRRQGPAAVADAALSRVGGLPGGFWVHADVDVLDPAVMPAVDSPEPDGLSLEQLEELLAPLVHHPRALGLQLTLYDPTLDGGAAAPALADLLVGACARSPW
jgi:arginase